MTDPTIASLAADHPGAGWDPHFARDAIEDARKRLTRIPPHYAEAVATAPEVRQWVHDLVGAALATSRTESVALKTGPSLLLLGPTGTGKTFQAYGALRALAETGVQVRWVFTTAADAYARLRPRHRVDAEDEFERLAGVPLLVLDDLGAAKASEWTEEVNYRLINSRYEHERATLITSNVAAPHLGAALGDRVTSRLVEMANRASLLGDDRRRTTRRTLQETP